MKKTLLAAALCAIALPSYADTTVNGKLSTLGLGLEAAFPMVESWDARLGLNAYNYNFNKTTASGGLTTNYSGSLNLQNVEALADWHPWESSFRVSGGLVYNGNKFNMTGLPQGGTIAIGNTNYAVPAGGAVSATVDFNKVAPYLGIGWGRTPKNTGLSFTSDIGVVFQGTPRGAVTASGIPGVAATDIANANASLNNALNNFKYYPVISIGIGYTW